MDVTSCGSEDRSAARTSKPKEKRKRNEKGRKKKKKRYQI
jgi:hypothetical protein